MKEPVSWYNGECCPKCTCCLIDTPELKNTCPRCHYGTWSNDDARWYPDKSVINKIETGRVEYEKTT